LTINVHGLDKYSIYEVPFEKPLPIVAGNTYTITLKDTGSKGCYTAYGSQSSSGHTSTIQRDPMEIENNGVLFQFMDSPENVGTSSTKLRGQIPRLYYYLL
jgi:hypothetical protein